MLDDDRLNRETARRSKPPKRPPIRNFGTLEGRNRLDCAPDTRLVLSFTRARDLATSTIDAERSPSIPRSVFTGTGPATDTTDGDSSPGCVERDSDERSRKSTRVFACQTAHAVAARTPDGDSPRSSLPIRDSEATTPGRRGSRAFDYRVSVNSESENQERDRNPREL